MASNTTHLDLLKKDPVSDATDNFDIDAMLNDNWDKIENQFAGRWEDLRVSANAVKINASTSKPDTETFLGNTTTLFFDGGTNESVTFSVQIPHAYLLGTDISPHVHWTPTDANTGTVIWILEYTWANIGDTFPTTTTTSGTGNASGTSYDHILTPLTDISGTSKNLSSMLICRITRDATTDTYASDAAFLEFDFHFQKNRIGTETETA